jgi:hypothetical protein
LDRLCASLRYLAKPKANCERAYVDSFEASVTALEERDADVEIEIAQADEKTMAILQEYLKDCEAGLETLTTAMTQAVLGNEGSSKVLAFSLQQMPRITPILWLSHLKRERFNTLSEAWKAAIIEYGLAITRLHRAHRLVHVSNKPLELAEELHHIGHTNWSPHEYPETLLLEVESGIMLREVQETIAGYMRSPDDNVNTVIQLNMGEGKSGTILPVVAAALADGQR